MSENNYSNFVNHFKLYLNSNFSSQYIRKGYSRNKLIKIRRLDSLARIFNSSNSQNCTAVALYNNKLYIASNIDKVEFIQKQILKLKNYIKKKKLPNKNDSERFNKDFRKVVSSIVGIGHRRYKGRNLGKFVIKGSVACVSI